MHRVWFLAVVAAALLVPNHAFGEKPPRRIDLKRDGFEEIAREHGVTVYKDKNSDIITLGAEGRIPAPPRRVQQALLDYPRQKGVVEALREVRVLKRGPNWLLVYQRLALPVIDDRDFTLYVKHGEHDGMLWVSYVARSNAGPGEQSGVVRVTNNRGAWELEPIDGGRATRVRYEMSIDLAGSVPMWLAKSGAGDEMPKAFASICRLSVARADRNKCG
jgi:hypothetical protein